MNDSCRKSFEKSDAIGETSPPNGRLKLAPVGEIGG
jgi:hypothetical protein